MQASDFLFPKDLEATPVKLKKILFIGSCLSEAYVNYYRKKDSDISVDHILFNNAVDLPEKDIEEIISYDLHYVQLPLRSVLTDGFIRQADSQNRYFDWTGYGKSFIDRMLEKALEYNKKSGILTLVSNFLVPQGVTAASLDRSELSDDISHVVRELNAYLIQAVASYKNVFVADVDMIANSIGKSYFLDDTIVFHSHGSMIYPDWAAHERYPYWTAPDSGRIDDLPDLLEIHPNKTYEYFDAVYRQIVAAYRTVHQVDMVKLVIFDLDNTLWRGQLAEHYKPGEKWPYFDGWPLGVWETVQILKRRGIMVSISSKNDHDYVVKHWQDAVPLGFIKFDDFILPKVNWRPKAENIMETIKQLSLTPKSVVFVDDNPVERESVAAQVPGIRVIGSNPFLTRRTLLWAPETQISKITEESSRREEMLKAQVERENAKATMSRDEFLQSLNTEVDVWSVDSTESPSFSRVLELVNKTNQFNTTGERWSVDDYVSHFTSGGRVYGFRVRDRFTDYGTVGVVFIKANEIIQFVMSCRVLGMDIENSILIEMINSIRSSDADGHIIAKFVETPSNTPCRQVYSSIGFEKDGNDYVLDANKTLGSSVVKLNWLQ
ncbi:HAD-IIIC family phosphatase [Allorhizobium sp. BGMRC 0089]|uniref:HAD-IIIC family phosphatase n=1 Tax=Allorhizobium sonneratiae TaxID=2934936 RepID=UPI002033A5B8|nr:HAD-IIIC family phosphatase [Allorhizobium sonneratiae]MCM2292767.1 HAD-IIIC family phosphatase [Allorhizobium sonneratiae]